MAEPNSFESLQELHSDLLALSESRLLNVERLETQLEAHIQAFRALLDKNARNKQKRDMVETGIRKIMNKHDMLKLMTWVIGELEIGGNTYTVNKEFQLCILVVADELDLDELDAAEIVLQTQSESEASGQSFQTCSVIQFHQRREALLECLRLILQLSTEDDRDENQRDALLELLVAIIEPKSTPEDATSFTRKCLISMDNIITWLQGVADTLNAGSVAGKSMEILERFEYQRVSLLKQHELLAIIVFHLVKQGHSSVADFERVLERLRKADKFDNILREYSPFSNI